MNFSLKKPLPGFFDRGDTPTKPLVVCVLHFPPLLPCLALSVQVLLQYYRSVKIKIDDAAMRFWVVMLVYFLTPVLMS